MNFIKNSFYSIFCLFLLVMAILSPNLTTSLSFVVLLLASLTFIFATRDVSEDNFNQSMENK